ncbi:MAG: sigma 54-interacting transcriptional regulator [Myxococcales bacterium]|nr:sigma 54-interacting transcriptional regulator [Myxococcales bacterium]
MQDKTTARVHGTAIEPGHEEPARVIVLGPTGPKQFVVVVGGTTIGRAFPSDVIVDDPSVSKQHLRVWLAEDKTVRFADLGSTNGTFLNGLAVASGTFAVGDALRIGSVQLQRQPTTSVRPAPGLLAFDAFALRLAEEERAHLETAQPFSILVVEGRATAPLSEWAPLVLASIGAKDRASLLREDAIVVLLVGKRRSEARSLASAIANGDGGLRVGVATYPEHGRSVSALVHHALAANDGEPLARSGVHANGAPDGVVRGRSTERLWTLVDRAAPSNVPVLITGESGTGKEVVARALHDRSSRRDKPLRAVNCGAIPANLVESTLFGAERGAFTGADRVLKGLFEQAHGGTLFLDEIGELSLAAQASLLRVLETGRVTRIGAEREIIVDVRVVSATHRALERRCDEGAFRWDLYYRLNGLEVEIPPLRERRDEVEPLALQFLAAVSEDSPSRPRAIGASALEALRRYEWPGNIRELRHCIQRAALVANGPTIVEDDLTERVRRAPDSARPNTSGEEMAVSADGEGLRKALERHEHKLISDALAHCGGNTTAAAALLKIPVRTLTHKMTALGIKK